MSKHKIPYSYKYSFLSTSNHLGEIRRLGYKQFLYFLLYFNSLKQFFVSKTKFNCFKKMFIFSYSLLQKIIKLRRSSLRLVFLIKIVYNQFLLLKNYRLWHWIRSFVWFIRINLESVIFDFPKATKSQLERSQLKFYKVCNKKRRVKKRKTSNDRSRVFEVALEGGRKWKFCFGEL